MMKRILPLLAAFLIAAPALSQDAAQPLQLLQAASAETPDAPRILHITNVLLESAEGQAALQEFHRLKEIGLTAGKTAESYEIGETRMFKVRNISTNTFQSREFTLKLESERFDIWVETAELTNGHVRDQDVEEMRAVLADHTPAGSINTNAGIIVNNETIFGNPPNLDNDSRTDVLLVDVRDSFDPANGVLSYVAGFFDPADLTSTGNLKDIIYIDTSPGLVNHEGIRQPLDGSTQTLAHEYQHLIHANFDADEVSFVNEGLSEWAEIMNGYEARSISYLSDASEQNVSLMTWRGNSSPEVLNDYQRAGLFTTYLAERMGPAAVGSITREKGNGADGYNTVLSNNGLALKPTLANFHTANFLNDIDIDNGIYGYLEDNYAFLSAKSTLLIDGNGGTETARTQRTVNSGAVHYITWTNVADLALSFDAVADPTLLETVRTRLQARMVLEHDNGPIEVRAFNAGLNPTTFEGTFDRATLVVVHGEPTVSASATFAFSATWTSANPGEVVQNQQYDNGQVDPAGFFNLSAGASGATATRFEVPSEGPATLNRAFILPFFLSQFSNGGQPPNAPTDVTFTVWDDNNGVPGEVRFSKVVSGIQLGVNCPASGFCTILQMHEIDLSDHTAELANLPPVIHIGYTEAGTDNNYMVIGPSPYTTANVSYIRSASGSWGRLWDVQFQVGDPDPLINRMVPVRAEFLVATSSVANEDPAELPARITLDQNYPNPFNPTTAITYSLPQATNVRLTVYDLLGRQVAMLVDGFLLAGRHEARFDATTRSSGLYLYTLEADGLKQTRTMLLVK